MLHDQSHAACTCPCCMSMSILHIHVHVACPCQCCMSMSISMDIYIEMPECRNAGLFGIQSVWYRTEKNYDTETGPYRTKLTQSRIFLDWYQTKIRDARMPMTALVFSIPVPRYACTVHITPIICKSRKQHCANSLHNFRKNPKKKRGKF